METSLEAAPWRVIEWSERELATANGGLANGCFERCGCHYRLTQENKPEIGVGNMATIGVVAKVITEAFHERISISAFNRLDLDNNLYRCLSIWPLYFPFWRSPVDAFAVV
jgi:hypothetical protein